METIKNTSVLIVLAGIFYGIYQFATGSESIFPSNTAHNSGLNQSENLASAPQSVPSNLNSSLPAPNLGNNHAGSMNGAPSQGLNSHQNQPSHANQFQTGPGGNSLPPTTLPESRDFPPNNQQNNTGQFGLGQQGNALPSSQPGQQPGLTDNTQNGNQSIGGFPGSLPSGVSQAGNAGLNERSQIPGRTSEYVSGNQGNSSSVAVTGLNGQSMDLQPIRRADGTSGVGPSNTVNLPVYHQEMVTAFQNAKRNIEENKHLAALQSLTPWLDRQVLPQDRARLLEWLDRLASEVIYSKQHHLRGPYRTQRGDTFRNLAKRLNITPYILANINQVKVQNFDAVLPEGTEIKLIQGPFQAKADIKSQELTLFLGNLYAGRFRYKLGQSAPVANGVSGVSQITLNGLPAQSMDNGARIEPMSEGNPYGRYCIIFGDNVLHSPGKLTEGGCMIFSEEDMVDLIAILDQDSKVAVQNVR